MGGGRRLIADLSALKAVSMINRSTAAFFRQDVFSILAVGPRGSLRNPMDTPPRKFSISKPTHIHKYTPIYDNETHYKIKKAAPALPVNTEPRRRTNQLDFQHSNIQDSFVSSPPEIFVSNSPPRAPRLAGVPSPALAAAGSAAHSGTQRSRRTRR